ncbi:MAG: substrate-binding domain-containing protein, partial [Firmicutes bacterium]|nr:substrate-binding domain-containing protein [Bacillota bacterium]
LSLALCGCDGFMGLSFGGGTSETNGVFVFVAKDTQNPYMKKVYEGFESACADAGVKAVYDGPKTVDPQKQVKVIEELIEDGVDGIAVAANDVDALEEPLQKAMDAGIQVISLDSAVNADSRMTHIQQADPEKIGRGLIQAAYEMVNGNGGIAILSTTENATNQSLWVDYMLLELEENEQKYKNTPLITIAYGEDDSNKSEDAAEELLKNPDIDVIVAPTCVGLLAAAKVLKKKKSNVCLTGLGLPSEMAQYIEDGTCEWMYLWNPVDIGYLAGYTLKALHDGEITGAGGDTFKAGKLGEKTVTAASDGGTEVMLGEPFKFDKYNIYEWKDIY